LRAERAEAQVIRAESAAIAANETISALLDEVAKLTDALRDQPGSILTNLTPLFLGYREDPAKETKKQQMITDLGVSFDDKERGVWFPDIEFDEAMESSDKWPVPGQISGPPTGMTERMDEPNHSIQNGRVARTDGQTMFQAGATAPPPESGVE
jgi:hypothetical protein